MSEVLLFERKNRTAYITINRPEKLNAINYDIRKGLADAWRQVNDDPDIYSVIITGGDKVFSVGADIKENVEYRKHHGAGELPPLKVPETYGANVKKPVIAAINGYCLGVGFLIALYCDIRVASDSVVFGYPEVKVGIVPAIGSVKMVQYLPMAIALELLLTGENINAEDAYRLGLINKVVPQHEVMSTAEAYANTINKRSPLIVQSIKHTFYKGCELSPQAMALASAMSKLARYSEDAREGFDVFLEKRKPTCKAK